MGSSKEVGSRRSTHSRSPKHSGTRQRPSTPRLGNRPPKRGLRRGAGLSMHHQRAQNRLRPGRSKQWQQLLQLLLHPQYTLPQAPQDPKQLARIARSLARPAAPRNPVLKHPRPALPLLRGHSRLQPATRLGHAQLRHRHLRLQLHCRTCCPPLPLVLGGGRNRTGVYSSRTCCRLQKPDEEAAAAAAAVV